jgi:hypothetical protein
LQTSRDCSKNGLTVLHRVSPSAHWHRPFPIEHLHTARAVRAVRGGR